ncbi:hypothetical protein [Fibrobacter sp.]|uniref:hypothetical protein n=1 Tax=Fibrobacter sp. TaxID=35828 RepID=UPI0025BB0A14|nr:hypothetical protein [Fibrobacter sp.]MCI6438335.1 hypothetical protein [Fibrobacter sp.]MDD7497673.1 hypothetical protein [Fibrobacter sp.]MDY5723899.1 hypothetical protein [Fibrobacter sp.]
MLDSAVKISAGFRHSLRSFQNDEGGNVVLDSFQNDKGGNIILDSLQNDEGGYVILGLFLMM